MFFLIDVFGTLTLQSSTIVLSSVFITQAVCVLSRNVLSFNEFSMAWMIMFLFVLSMVLIWWIAFMGAYKESYKIISATAISWTIYIVIWIGLIVWSFFNTQSNKSICIEFRCPNGLWLLYNSRRDLHEGNQLIDSLDQGSIKNQKNITLPQYEKTIKPQIINGVDKYRTIAGKKQKRTPTTIISRVAAPIELAQNDEEKCIEKVKTNLEVIRTYCGTHLEPTSHLASEIVSIIFSFLYALILIFSWMVLISYRREIRLQIDFLRYDPEIIPSN